MPPSWGPNGRNPWQELPAEVATALRPRLDGIAAEMIAAIRHEVREYQRPLDSRFGRDLVSAVRTALAEFVELIEHPSRTREDHVELFRRLGAAEFRNGRSMDVLQAAYRVGARVACRRYIEITQAAGLPPDTMLLLSEAVLTHINALAGQSVRGFAEAKARDADELGRARRLLAERLLDRDPPASGSAIETLAERARWPLPATVACAAIGSPGRPFDAVRIDRSFLAHTEDGELFVLVPDPDRGDRLDRLRAAVHGRRTVLGPTVRLREAWLSLGCARLAARLARRGLVADGEFLVVADQLGDLLLLHSEPITRLLGERTLGALDGLAAAKANRLEETLAAFLASAGRTAPEVAEALDIHPQTARNRLRQLHELLGDRLTDPAFRLEAELVLRTRALLRASTS